MHLPGAETSRRRSEPAPLRPRLQRAGWPFSPQCCQVSIQAMKTRRPRTQQRRPLHPIPLVSPRDGSSFRHLGSGRSELLLFQPKNHIERRAANVRLGNYSEDAGAARLSDIGDGASYQAARCGARQRRRSAHRVVTAGPTVLCHVVRRARFRAIVRLSTSNAPGRISSPSCGARCLSGAPLAG